MLQKMELCSLAGIEPSKRWLGSTSNSPARDRELASYLGDPGLLGGWAFLHGLKIRLDGYTQVLWRVFSNIPDTLKAMA
jgi:hypothetical protein